MEIRSIQIRIIHPQKAKTHLQELQITTIDLRILLINFLTNYRANHENNVNTTNYYTRSRTFFPNHKNANNNRLSKNIFYTFVEINE